MTRSKFALIGIAILAICAATGFIATHRADVQKSADISDDQTGDVSKTWFKRVPAELDTTVQNVIESREKGDFDKAIGTALGALRGGASDDILFEALADTYFERAQTDHDSHDRWIVNAVEYSEKAFRSNPSDVVNQFNLGQSYATAGYNFALGSPSSCKYFKEAMSTMEDLNSSPRLQGEWGIVEGERVRLVAYRMALRNKIEEVHTALSKCTT